MSLKSTDLGSVQDVYTLGPCAEITAAVKNHHDMMEHWEALLPGHILAVPYEALVADQEGWTRRMLQHCGLPWDDAVLRFHDTQRDVHTASVSQARPFPLTPLCCLTMRAS